MKMDFDGILMKLQGTLLSLPNQPSDEQRLKMLSELFEPANDAEKCRMVYFMMLNTNLSLADLMKEDENLYLLMDACQRIEVSYLMRVLADLKAVGYLRGVISNYPSVISKELLDNLCESDGLTDVLIGILEKLLKIEKGMHMGESSRALRSYWKKLSMRLLEGFETKSIEEKVLICDSLMDFNKRCCCLVKLDRLEDDTLYQMDHSKFQEEVQGRDCRTTDDNIKDLDVMEKEDCTKMVEVYLKDYVRLLLEVMKQEIRDESRKQLSEKAFALREELPLAFCEDVVIELESVMVKPETEADVIARSDVDEIMKKVSFEKSKNWFEGLIRRAGALESDLVADFVLEHLEMAGKQDMNIILDELESRKRFHDLYIAAFKRLDAPDQSLHFDRYFSVFEIADREIEMTEMFNKLSKSDVNAMRELRVVCMTAPTQTIAKLLELALSSESQIKFCIECLVTLKAACLSAPTGTFSRLQKCLQDLLLEYEDRSEKEQQILVKVFRQSGKVMGLDGSSFIDQEVACLSKNMQDPPRALYALSVLETALDMVSSYDRTPLIACLSAVLNNASWDASDFSMLRANLRKSVIALVSNLLDGPEVREGAKAAWLRGEVQKHGEISQTYSCDLWYLHGLDFPCSPDLYVQLMVLLHSKSRSEFVIGNLVNEFKSMELSNVRMSFNEALVKLLPILITEEWTGLYSRMRTILTRLAFPDTDPNMEVFRIITTSMFFLTKDLTESKPCFEYCIRNYGRAVQLNLPDDPGTYEHWAEIVRGIMFVLSGVSDEDCRRNSSLILSGLVLGVAKRATKLENEENVEKQVISVAKLENWFRKAFIV